MWWVRWCWDLASLWLLVRAAARQVQRPTSSYRAGALGKAAAVVVMVALTTVVLGWVVPAGALWVLWRKVPEDPVSVPLADGWPGRR
jgi:phosphatidylglycerophosphate synthase